MIPFTTQRTVSLAVLFLNAHHVDIPNLKSLKVGRSDFWCSIYAFSQKQGLSSTNGFEMYSESTRIVIPPHSCNEDIEELRFDGYSKLEELYIGENSFSKMQHVVIDSLSNLQSIQVDKNSFSSNGLDEKKVQITNCSALNVLSIDSNAFSDFNMLQLDRRCFCILVSRITKPQVSRVWKYSREIILLLQCLFGFTRYCLVVLY